MSLLVKIVNGEVAEYPYNFERMREDFSNISFPFDIDYSAVAHLGVFPVEHDPQPAPQSGFRIDPHPLPTFRDGAWRLGWTLVEDPNAVIPDELEIITARMVEFRNQRLYESDWTQLPDAPVNHEAWAIYRQALRDITETPGWPTEVDWPLPPDA